MGEMEKSKVTLYHDGKPVDMATDAKVTLKAEERESDNIFTNPTSFSMSFKAEASEETMDFFRRMQDELATFEKAIDKRIEQLMDEHVGVDDTSNDTSKGDKAYEQLLALFGLGYKLGWNDRKKVDEHFRDRKVRP